eukprot:scaffold97995_cov18-Tisochrysis_lutea.AAC.2
MAGRVGLAAAARPSKDPKLRVVLDGLAPALSRSPLCLREPAEGEAPALLAAAASWREGPANRSARVTPPCALLRFEGLAPVSPPDAPAGPTRPRSCRNLTSSELMPACLELRC